MAQLPVPREGGPPGSEQGALGAWKGQSRGAGEDKDTWKALGEEQSHFQVAKCCQLSLS